jgi:hypothetical protein
VRGSGAPCLPPAEVALVRRLAELQPDLRVHAVFDLDSAGIRIARLLEEGAGVTPRRSSRCERRSPRLVRSERETIQQRLYALLD